MLSSDNNMFMTMFLSEKLKSNLEDQFSLSKTEENVSPVKTKKKSGIKALLIIFIILIITGLYVTSPNHSINTHLDTTSSQS